MGTPYVPDDQSVSEASTPTPGGEPVHTLDSLARMISTVVSQNHTIVQKFDGVHSTLAAHASEIKRIDRRIETGEKEMAQRMEELLDVRLAEIKGQLSHPTPGPSSSSSTKKTKEAEAYWLTRRNLWLSPVPGADLKQGVIDYTEETLQASSASIRSLPQTAFRRPPSNRNSTVKEEVVVTIANQHDRDYFRSLSFKLAGKKDHSIRLELPGHLLGQHRVLGMAGQSLRAGRTGCRTVIKFDDDNMRLVLDYRLQDDNWKRLCPDQASRAVGTSLSRGGAKETTAEAFKNLLRPTSGANATPLGE